MGILSSGVNTLWNSLTYSVERATESILSSKSYYTHFRNKQDGVLQYKSKSGYQNNSIWVHSAKRLGFQLAEHYANLLLDLGKTQARYVLQRIRGQQKNAKLVEKIIKDTQAEQEKLRRDRLELQKKRSEQANNYQKLIEKGNKIDNDLGVIKVEGGQTISAVDCYGRLVKESLMLYYETEKEMDITTIEGVGKEKITKTKTLCFFDVNAQVSQSTTKNVILTKVQGRDYTRKELVSGGDIVFTVNGMINSNLMGVYPSDAVKKFVQLCQYNGVIKINHFLAKQFGVTQVIVQDFKLNTQDCLNIQPYSMTLIAVEPDENITVLKDTITIINDALAANENEGWYKQLLELKMGETDKVKAAFNKEKAERDKFLKLRNLI